MKNMRKWISLCLVHMAEASAAEVPAAVFEGAVPEA